MEVFIELIIKKLAEREKRRIEIKKKLLR